MLVRIFLGVLLAALGARIMYVEGSHFPHTLGVGFVIGMALIGGALLLFKEGVEKFR